MLRMPHDKLKVLRSLGLSALVLDETSVLCVLALPELAYCNLCKHLSPLALVEVSQHIDDLREEPSHRLAILFA